MPRIESRPIVAVGLMLAILGHIGCVRVEETARPDQTSKQVRAGASTGEQPVTPPDNAKLFADWPGLLGAIAVTGEMDGYLDPCGCTEGQLGGLGRRYDLFERMRKLKIPVVKIDLGSLTKNPASARGGLEQERAKFEFALKALKAMNYDALGLSPEDLKLEIQQTLSFYLNEKEKIKVVAANVAPAGDFKAAFEGLIRESVTAQAGPFKVGITSVVDPAVYKELKDPDVANLEVKDPRSVLPGVLKGLESSTDFQVLMVQGPPDLARALGESFPGFDLVVSTSLYADPAGKPETINGGATQLVSVGQKGKYVGVVGLFAPKIGKTPEVRYERVSLRADRFRNAEPMRVLVDEEMQSHLKAIGVVENYLRHANSEAAPGATYVGAEGCKSCHPNTYAKWAGTNHARAYDVLVNNPKDARRRREFDAECISCHTTGFTYTSGWESPSKTPYLKGNQCENCHGPASKHVEEPDNKDFARFMTRSVAQADKGGLCHKCHDDDNSPKFEFPPTTARSRTRAWTSTPTRASTKGWPPSRPARPGDRRVGLPEKEFPMASAKFERMVAKYRGDHTHPVNHVLHVFVGWPMVAAAVLLLPFRPWWSLALLLGGYALMFTGHFAFEKNTPTILKHPSTPFVVAWAVIRGLLGGLVRLATPGRAR